MNQILVTGGGGFVGSHLCETLLEDGHEVVCLDNFASGRPANIGHIKDRSAFTLINGDVRAQPTFEKTFDAIYHLASWASPADFEVAPVDIAVTNSEGTHEMLELARAHDARFLLASTSEVYGDPEVHPQTEDYWGNVNPRGPRAVYDEGKRFAEALTSAYVREYDVDARTVRIFNTYGPRMDPNDGRVVPNFFSQALTGRELTVYGDGLQTRSFCYVSDLISGIVAIMNRGGLKGEVLNLGNPNEQTILELAEVIVDVVGADSDVAHESLPEDDPKRRKPDISKTQDLLDWEPSVDLRSGIRRSKKYFKRSVDTELYG